jgi:predicted Zn-dependent protease
MEDLDDDEVAVVLGHEIAHASHEHSRRQAKKGVWAGIAGEIAAIGAGMIDNSAASAGTAIAGSIGAGTYMNAYSRDAEDQADRVGLRYVYEAGYDVRKAPELWRRFAKKYGDGSKASNFFFGDHSLSSKRASDLEREIAHNYRDPALDPPTARKLTSP